MFNATHINNLLDNEFKNLEILNNENFEEMKIEEKIARLLWNYRKDEIMQNMQKNHKLPQNKEIDLQIKIFSDGDIDLLLIGWGDSISFKGYVFTDKIYDVLNAFNDIGRKSNLIR